LFIKFEPAAGEAQKRRRVAKSSLGSGIELEISLQVGDAAACFVFFSSFLFLLSFGEI